MCGFCYLSQCCVEATDWMKKNFVFNSWQGEGFFPASKLALGAP